MAEATFLKNFTTKQVPFLFLVILQPINYCLTKYLIMDKLRLDA